MTGKKDMMEGHEPASERPEEIIELLDIVAQDGIPTDNQEGMAGDMPPEAASVQACGHAGTGVHTGQGHGVKEARRMDISPGLETDGAEGAQTDAALPHEPSGSDRQAEGFCCCDRAGGDESLVPEGQNWQERCRVLEERLGDVEKKCRELAESVDGLQQQLAEAGSMILEDAAVRLRLEELVSRMLDARFSGCEEHGVLLQQKLDVLEKRMDEAEAQAEQKTALAAARVIRDEIAAIRAGHC